MIFDKNSFFLLKLALGMTIVFLTVRQTTFMLHHTICCKIHKLGAYMFKKTKSIFLFSAFLALGLVACKSSEKPTDDLGEEGINEDVPPTTGSEESEPIEMADEGASSDSYGAPEEPQGSSDSQGLGQAMPEGLPEIEGVSAQYKAVNSCDYGADKRGIAVLFMHENAANTPPDQMPDSQHQVPCEVHYYRDSAWKKVAWADNTAGYCQEIAGVITGRIERGGFSCVGPIEGLPEPQPTPPQPMTPLSDDQPDYVQDNTSTEDVPMTLEEESTPGELEEYEE
jgi:hypothetical protein